MTNNSVSSISQNSRLGFSIIVATYNLQSYLTRCIESLQQLDYDKYEIIVISDCSTDSTRAYLDNLQIPNLRVIHNEKNEGTCNSRNHGIAIAKYPLIAFTDHDCCPHQDWLTTLEKYFQNNTTDFVFGAVEYVARDYHGYFPERLVRNPAAHWPMGCNFAFRIDKIRALGGFDPELFPYGNEDTELSLRAITRGMQYERAPDAIVTHQQINWTPKSLLRSARYASVWPLLAKRYPKNYRHFGGSVKWGMVTNPEDYLYFLILPILIPFLLVRYFYHGKRDLKIFFTKWSVYLFVRRYYIWREAWRQKVLIF